VSNVNLSKKLRKISKTGEGTIGPPQTYSTIFSVDLNLRDGSRIASSLVKVDMSFTKEELRR